MINRVTLVGYCGKDPEIRNTPGGKAVANFSIATSEKFKNAKGEAQEHTEWHNIVAWGALADITGKYLKKGGLVYIEGKIKTRSWETTSGEKKYITEINADRIQLLAGGRTQATQSRQSNQDVPWE